MPKFNQLFNSIRVNRPRLNKFDLGHERKMSMRMGTLTPFLVQDILPGDKFRVNTEIMMRLAPMLAPVMHRVNVWTHYWFVPNRLVWSAWEEFITGGPDGTSEPVSPYITINNDLDGLTSQGDLLDYMGFPVFNSPTPTITQPVNISALPFRAYQLIWDEWYRDQTLQTTLGISKASGAVSTLEATKLLTIRNRAWEKDYYTSALPNAQRGPDAVIPVEGEGEAVYSTDPGTLVTRTAGGAVTAGDLNTAGGLTFGTIRDGANQQLNVENIDHVEMDSVNVTVNELRRSMALQRWLEKMARGGARYAEQLLVQFGVVSDDARLQRPEYLGGGMQPVSISEVLQTSEAAEDPLGTMGGHGISVGSRNGFQRRFKEHGFLIGVMSVLPRTGYQQGIPKWMRKFDKFDYAWPDFANLGEQEVKVGELYYDPEAAPGEVDETFGYQSRYSEYKYCPSSSHGQMRQSLAYWHMNRIFESKPVLNSSFVSSNPTDRIFAVQDGSDNLWVQLYNRVDALRPLPYFGTPL